MSTYVFCTLRSADFSRNLRIVLVKRQNLRIPTYVFLYLDICRFEQKDREISDEICGCQHTFFCTLTSSNLGFFSGAVRPGRSGDFSRNLRMSPYLFFFPTRPEAKLFWSCVGHTLRCRRWPFRNCGPLGWLLVPQAAPRMPFCFLAPLFLVARFFHLVDLLFFAFFHVPRCTLSYPSWTVEKSMPTIACGRPPASPKCEF